VLDGAEVAVEVSSRELLADDHSVALGDRAIEVIHFGERGVTEATRRGSLLEASRRASEVAAQGSRGDPQRAAMRLPPRPRPARSRLCR